MKLTKPKQNASIDSQNAEEYILWFIKEATTLTEEEQKNLNRIQAGGKNVTLVLKPGRYVTQPKKEQETMSKLEIIKKAQLTPVAQGIVDKELSMLSGVEKSVAGLMLDSKNKHEIMRAMGITETKLNPILCQIYKKTESIVNYRTIKTKRLEFIDYYLYGSSEKEIINGNSVYNEQKTIKNEQKTPSCEQIADNREQNKQICEPKADEVCGPPAHLKEKMARLKETVEKEKDNSLTILKATCAKYEKEYIDRCFAIGQQYLIDSERPSYEVREKANKAKQKFELILEIIGEVQS